MKDIGGATGDKRDFSNPMYEAMAAEGGAGASADFGISNASSRSSTMSPSSEAGNDYVIGGPAGRHAFENFEPTAAVLAPSSVTHKSSPQLAARHKEVSPSAVDTGKDTQCLVEEDDSEC
jgi:low density lipoprotein-related protein 2